MPLDKTLSEGRVRWHSKSRHTFYSTMVGNRSMCTNIDESNTEIQHLQLMIGSTMYPEYPIRSHACFYSLRK